MGRSNKLTMRESGKLVLIVSLMCGALIMALGTWWLYFISRLGSQFERLSALDPSLKGGPNIALMIKWEGTTFIILLLLIFATLLYQYLKDRKKNRALQSFFATMTHELKTPLASVRLQAEVIYDLLIKKQHERISGLAERFIEDTQRWETQMDKILQLSRVEHGGNMCKEIIPTASFIQRCHKKWAKDLELQIIGSKSPAVLADEFALELVFRNLFENTKAHSKSSIVQITLSPRGQVLDISYCDGDEFSGDGEKLGELFYKHSSKGSGIGLYLSKKLMSRMGGIFKISTDPKLIFSLSLPIADKEEK